MFQPDELKKNERLLWSTGTGTDVWQMICAAMKGDVQTIEALLTSDPSLARCQYNYRTPLDFAVRENQLAAAALLLDRSTDPIGLSFKESLLEICRDRGYSAMETLLESKLLTAHNASPAGEPVAAAIRARDLPKVRSLLDASPELLHAGDARSNQPIHWAVMTRQIDMIDELLGASCGYRRRSLRWARPIQLTNGDYNFRGWRDVPESVTTTPAEVLAHLRGRGAYVDICTAASIGDLDPVRELVDQDPALVESRFRIRHVLHRVGLPAAKCGRPRSHRDRDGSCSTAAPIPICPRKASLRAAMPCIRPCTTGTMKSPSCCSNMARFPARRSKAPPMP